jgi:hypothetical protein
VIRDEDQQPTIESRADLAPTTSRIARSPLAAEALADPPATSSPVPRTAAQLARLDATPAAAHRPAVPVKRPDHQGPAPTPSARSRSGP